MSTEHMRRLRAVGITTPRLQEDTASLMWQRQTERLRSLATLQAQSGTSQATLRFLSEAMVIECDYALRVASAQARDDDEHLDFYDMQLWDMAEMMLKSDADGRRCVSLSVVGYIQQMMTCRHFSTPTYSDLVYVIENWREMISDEETAVDEYTMSCLGAFFSQFLTYQMRIKERAVTRFLKQEQVGTDFSDSCAICAAEVQPGEFITKLAPFCTHWFHTECIKAWLMTDIEGKPTCPMCRAHIDLPGHWQVGARGG